MSDSTSFVCSKQAAAFLGLSVPALYLAVRRDECPAYRFGQRRLRFRLDELAALMKKVDSPATSMIHKQESPSVPSKSIP
jgi:excisionase family DNA binding protein